MSLRAKLRNALLCLFLGSALMTGAPMHPDEIEELLSQLHQPKLVQVVRKQVVRREDEPSD